MKAENPCECGREIEYTSAEPDECGDCVLAMWVCGCGRVGRDVYDIEDDGSYEYAYRQIKKSN